MPKAETVQGFVSTIVDKPQVFFTPNNAVADRALNMAKHFFAAAKEHETVELSPFTELLTEGFDHDQIWEEIATQNDPMLEYASATVQDFMAWEDDASASGHSLDQDLNDSQNELSDDLDAASVDGDVDMGDDIEEEDNLEDADADEDEDMDMNMDPEADEQEDEDEEDEESEEEAPKSSKKQSEVDDDFFNLEEFNKWSEEQERVDMKSDSEDDDENDEDGIDFDQDLAGEEDDDEDDLGDAADINYADFFEPAPKAKKGKGKKKVQFAQEDDIEEQPSDAELGFDAMEDDNEEDEDEEDEEDQVTKRNLFDADEEDEEADATSTHQKRLQRVQDQIEEFENENINARHWTLQGEANAKSRPVNSLLEEDLEFDQSVKPVPVITQETTDALEDMIKKRIIDHNFDDVERKSDPTARPFLPSKQISISDERGKKSLAELYEEDYVKQRTGDTSNEKDEALEKEHEAIDGMVNDLFSRLDALSNFFYTPKAPKADINVVTNAPAISMEEVMPVNVSDATMLAPEEVYDKQRRDVKSQGEMSQEERKRARALKKKLKRKDQALKEREKKVLGKTNANVGHKQAKMNAVKELMKHRNVEIIKNK